jgi:hypothetical protein
VDILARVDIDAIAIHFVYNQMVADWALGSCRRAPFLCVGDFRDAESV